MEELTREERVAVLARVTHEANAAWCLAHGDTSQPPWDEAPDWQTSSARDGVEFALAGASPEELHENWSALKIREGWTYGEEKDPEAKTHPCLVPYDQLPEQQRTKDALFHAIVAALAEPLDLLPKGVTEPIE